MSRKSTSRVEFSPDIYESPTILTKHKHHPTYNNFNENRYGNWAVCRHVRDNSNSNNNHQLYNSGPLRFLRRLGDKTARMLRFIGRSSSRKSKVVSSNYSPTASSSAVGNNNLMRSRSLVDQSESHRAQAIEDCIEFLHSYSSLQRCSSVSSSCL